MAYEQQKRQPTKFQIRKCPICDKDFKWLESDKPQRKFCSHRCANIKRWMDDRNRKSQAEACRKAFIASRSVASFDGSY